MNYILGGIEPMPTAKQLEETILRYLPDARLSFNPDPLAMAFHKMSQGVRWDETLAVKEWGWKGRYRLDEMVKDFIRELTDRSSWYV